MSDEIVKCPICGFPLYHGNVKREKREGKRTRRVHRVCPTGGLVTKKEHEELHTHSEPVLVKVSEPAPSYTTITKTLLEESYFDARRSAVDSIIRQTEIPYHFFIRNGDIERVVTAATKGVSLRVEVIPVHESLYDATPEYYNELTEIKWGEDL
jgi:hypothetical protein